MLEVDTVAVSELELVGLREIEGEEDDVGVPVELRVGERDRVEVAESVAVREDESVTLSEEDRVVEKVVVKDGVTVAESDDVVECDLLCVAVGDDEVDHERLLDGDDELDWELDGVADKDTVDEDVAVDVGEKVPLSELEIEPENEPVSDEEPVVVLLPEKESDTLSVLEAEAVHVAERNTVAEDVNDSLRLEVGVEESVVLSDSDQLPVGEKVKDGELDVVAVAVGDWLRVVVFDNDTVADVELERVFEVLAEREVVFVAEEDTVA